MLTKRTKYINKLAGFCTKVNSEKTVKYTSTILLPKTKFPHYLNANQTVERDKRIAKESDFDGVYEWQRDNVKGKEYTLLDGPPYANGHVHIGHAINKILKDIINRAQLVQGRKVHFVPGWDCHGLPIELKASSTLSWNDASSAVAIRKRARDFAKKTIADQKAAFRSWGVMAGWESAIYQTYDASYMIKQLQIWWELYSRGVVYRDLKPVYWSPSSGTALAEAELVYRDDHISPALTLRLQVVNEDVNGTPVYLLIWTTTPWTLPVNEAVCYSTNIKYSLVRIPGWEGFYIVATDCIPSLAEKWKLDVSLVKHLDISYFDKMKYKHPWRSDSFQPVVDSSHVTAAGTGLVHAAPAHGHDDFLVGLKHNLSPVSLINGEGRYTNEAGDQLAGLMVPDEGNEVVLKHLKSDVVHQERLTHSYPYDWRTNQPVIIRASQQWFIDTAQLKQEALDSLDKVAGSTERLRSLLSSRPYWCVSRQRAWGLPIPAFYHRTSGRPLVTKSIVNRLCKHLSEGETDAWWTMTDDELFPTAACQELFVKTEDVVRGEDIMDIWVDSGIAWSGLEGRIADVCIEGGDQHTGWFQSSLVTSVAVRGTAPTRMILTHGFAVDESGRKMSKSVGNVVDPQTVVRTFGVDALRWWVASHSYHTHVPVSERLLTASREQLNRIRATLKFLLGAINGVSAENLHHPAITTLDKYMLHVCRKTHHDVMEAYNAHAWHVVCTLINNFISGPISGLFVHVSKDRLYCDATDSARRLSCCYGLAAVLQTLTSCLAPILPHLAEEVYLHHPVPHGKFWYRTEAWSPPIAWNQPDTADVMDVALQIKSDVDKQTVSTGTARLVANLTLPPHLCAALKVMQECNESWDSELTELLQVACVRITKHSQNNNIELLESERAKCLRCRRFTASHETLICTRCQQVLHK